MLDNSRNWHLSQFDHVTPVYCQFESINIFMMSQSEKLKQEYLELRSKIEERVKEEEEKYFGINGQSRSVTTNVTYCPIHHHQPRGTYCCRHRDQSQSQYTNTRVLSSQRASDQPSINDALMQNLRMQQQTNNNLKLLCERFSNLGMRRSEPIRSMEHKPVHREDKKSDSHFGAESSKPAGTRRLNSFDHHRAYSVENSLSKSRKNQRSNKITNSHSHHKILTQPDKCQSEYFNTCIKRCPLHSVQQLKSKLNKRRRSSEIYKDSAHRNRKHEKDHLRSSYKLQQKYRKQLLARVAKNFFNNYGCN